MITAKQARDLAEQKFVEVYNAIENEANNGKFSYILYNRQPNEISKELKEHLESNGFQVYSNIDYDNDTDVYGHVLSSKKFIHI